MAPDGEMQQFSGDSANITCALTTVKVTMGELQGLFREARTVVIRGDEIVQGILLEELDAADPEVRRTLNSWGGTHFLHQTPEGTEVTLIRPHGLRPPERWWLHTLLGLATLLTTTIAGAYFLGRAPLALRWLDLGLFWLPVPVGINPGEIPAGFLFSLPLMAILLGHELGHYVVARRWGMNVSPPYFIPAPNWINFIGTFGAFIRLRSVVVNRTVLLDVGAGGPVASFLLSLPVALLGLAWSHAYPILADDRAAPYLVLFAGQRIWLGDSLLFGALRALAVPGEGVLLLHPLAFAGWLGLFVTALNLVPLAQLDGGHILFALVGPRQRYFGLAFLGLLIVLGRMWWGWWLWVVMILLLGRGSIRHPSVFDPEPPVSRRRKLLGWFCIAIFLITFMPLPLQT
jgi:Zn-dependent protease